MTERTLNLRTYAATARRVRAKVVGIVNQQLETMPRSRGKGRPSYNIPPLAALEKAIPLLRKRIIHEYVYSL